MKARERKSIVEELAEGHRMAGKDRKEIFGSEYGIGLPAGYLWKLCLQNKRETIEQKGRKYAGRRNFTKDGFCDS